MKETKLTKQETRGSPDVFVRVYRHFFITYAAESLFYRLKEENMLLSLVSQEPQSFQVRNVHYSG